MIVCGLNIIQHMYTETVLWVSISLYISLSKDWAWYRFAGWTLLMRLSSRQADDGQDECVWYGMMCLDLHRKDRSRHNIKR